MEEASTLSSPILCSPSLPSSSIPFHSLCPPLGSSPLFFSPLLSSHYSLFPLYSSLPLLLSLLPSPPYTLLPPSSSPVTPFLSTHLARMPVGQADLRSMRHRAWERGTPLIPTVPALDLWQCCRQSEEKEGGRRGWEKMWDRIGGGGREEVWVGEGENEKVRTGGRR